MSDQSLLSPKSFKFLYAPMEVFQAFWCCQDRDWRSFSLTVKHKIIDPLDENFLAKVSEQSLLSPKSFKILYTAVEVPRASWCCRGRKWILFGVTDNQQRYQSPRQENFLAKVVDQSALTEILRIFVHSDGSVWGILIFEAHSVLSKSRQLEFP